MFSLIRIELGQPRWSKAFGTNKEIIGHQGFNKSLPIMCVLKMMKQTMLTLHLLKSLTPTFDFLLYGCVININTSSYVTGLLGILNPQSLPTIDGNVRA